MRMTINHNGYHGHHTVRVNMPDGVKAGDVIEVSAAVARRVNAAVCGMSDCSCGETISEEISRGRYAITILADYDSDSEIDICGNYPQV